jgi:hypothetical protein
MTLYLSQKRWGRSCLHLAAALRDRHWRWHLAGIEREIHFMSMALNGPATAGGRR